MAIVGHSLLSTGRAVCCTCYGPYQYPDRTRTVRTVWCILIRSDFHTVLISTKQKLRKEIEMILN